MKQKKIGTFRDNIRRIFILEAIIPVFCVTAICLSLFLLFSHYTVKQSSQKANKQIAEVIESTVERYSDAVATLVHNDEIDWNQIDINELVEVRRVIYQLTKGTGYTAQLYVLDENLDSLLPDSKETDEFLKSQICKDMGIIWELDRKVDSVSIRLTTGDSPLLCLGATIREKGKHKGYVIVTLESAEFKRLLSKVSPQTVITDCRDWIYLTNNYVFQDCLGRFDRSIAGMQGSIKYKDSFYYLTRSEICDSSLIVYSITEQDMLISMNRILSMSVLVLFLTIIGITYFNSGRIANKSTGDIGEMSVAFEQVKKGNLERYLAINSSIEFQEIGEAYNMMLDGLKRQMAENKELAEHAAFAQVKQLEAQFNPHFLFNTLDNIRFMTKIDVNKADKMIVSLSNLLRYSINSAHEVLTVREELQFTQSYLDILKIRFNQRLTYEVTVSEEAMECVIPKLLIQPLIENAVKYGYQGQDKLEVRIEGTIVGKQLIIRCIDNGGGIRQDLLQEIQKNLQLPVNQSGHFGLCNIHRRIRLMYGEAYGVNIESIEQKETILTLILPIQRNEKGENENVESVDCGG